MNLPAKVRQTIYTVLSIAGYTIPVLVVFGIITSDKSSALINLVAFLGTICGTGLAGAAVKTKQQRANGVFAQTAPTTDELINSLNTIQEHINTQISDVQSKATDALSSVISVAGTAPGGKELTNGLFEALLKNQK